jgi:hypothetical protein
MKITVEAQEFGLLFSKVKDVYLSGPKMGWATFGAIFSQTHLVTLPARYPQVHS